MAVTPVSAVPALPYRTELTFLSHSATGTINPGDWLVYTGQYVMPTNSGHTAYWKTSGAGVAIESNPMIDQAGRSVVNSALLLLVEGTFWASANFSGQPANGVGAYPDATGSGVAGTTGLTGVGATWQTGQVVNHSALSGTATPQAAPVATVIGSRNFSNAGTGEIHVRLMALAPDVRG